MADLFPLLTDGRIAQNFLWFSVRAYQKRNLRLDAFAGRVWMPERLTYVCEVECLSVFRFCVGFFC